jgi:hypothetical protein
MRPRLGQPDSLKIRSHVSRFGERVPASSSRYVVLLAGTAAIRSSRLSVRTWIRSRQVSFRQGNEGCSIGRAEVTGRTSG